MEQTWNELTVAFNDFLPSLIAAIAILVVGWLLALVVRKVVENGLHRTDLDNRLASWALSETTERPKTERWIANAVYWLLLIFVFIAFFQVLGLAVITEPLNEMLVFAFEYLPRVLSALLLAFIAWLVANLARMVVRKVLSVANIDERVGRVAEADLEKTSVSISHTLGEAVYWLVLLLFLPAILEALSLEGLLLPIQAMIAEIVAYLPNLFAAGVILVIGWFAAKIIRRIVSNLLAAAGLDRLGERAGSEWMAANQRLSELAGLIVYILVLIPVILAALDALEFGPISEPVSEMLSRILNALPAIFSASLLLVIAYLVGRLVSRLATELLKRIGFDNLLGRLGFERVRTTPEETEEGASPQKRRSPSEIVGYLVLVVIMLLATMEAANLLNFEFLALLVAEFLTFVGRVVLAVVILMLGIYLAELATDLIRRKGEAYSNLLAMGAKVAILTLAGAMALRELGVANEIINLAFGILLGAVGVALALAFGLGARDAAGREVEKWVQDLKQRRTGPRELPPQDR